MKAAAILRVHTVEGKIWMQSKESEPSLYKGTLAEFLEAPALGDFAHIRTLGMALNAELILGLYAAKQQGKLASVEVATPAIVASRRDRRKPGPSLFELGLCMRSPSQGGFHEVVESDYHAYNLAVACSKPIKAPELLPLLYKHPAFKPLSWIETLWFVAAAGVLAYLIDPRWYIDECRPDRCQKLWEVLGLNLHTQRAVTLHRDEKRLQQVPICHCTLGAWKNAQHESAVKEIFDLAGIKPRADVRELGLRPCDFCWRTWGKYQDPVKADLRASQRFTDFLRQTWLGEIYKGSSALPEDRAGLFRAADFFKHEEEVYDYERYAASDPPFCSQKQNPLE